MSGRTIKQYYSNMKHMYAVYDREGRRHPAPQNSAIGLKAWQYEARAELRGLLGLDLMESCPLEPELYEQIDCPEYTIQRVRIQSAPELYIPLTVLVPKNRPELTKRPVWLHAFGHGSPQKMADSFLPRDPDDPMTKLLGSMSIGPAGMIELAKRGYLVIAFDSFGSGERLDYPYARREVRDIGADNPLNNVAAALGMSKLGLEVHDMMRVLDYAQSRPDCDGRAGVAGTSGGGHQSLFFAAIDERVCAAATSVWFYGFKESLIGLPHNCSCNYVPGLFNAFDCQDIAALVAPRALHVEAGLRDYLNGRKNGLGNMLVSFGKAKKSYELLNRPDALSLYVFDGGHGCETWNNEDMPAPRSGGGFIDFANEWLPLKGGEAR